jgi:hypothetical protein
MHVIVTEIININRRRVDLISKINILQERIGNLLLPIRPDDPSFSEIKNHT